MVLPSYALHLKLLYFGVLESLFFNLIYIYELGLSKHEAELSIHVSVSAIISVILNSFLLGLHSSNLSSLWHSCQVCKNYSF